ncbi:MAG: transcriptional repressor LexA [Firmicutes bacterium]|jgi:repressor LexA|nr:transcriptional repressor LexA [Bacillota bacterium]
MKPLTDKQKEIFQFIRDHITRRNYPPSIREICNAFGLRSTSTAHFYLTALEKKGYIRREPARPRAIELLVPDDGGADDAVFVPIVGTITAGKPILAAENIEGYFPLPLDLFPGTDGKFMLRIRGDSMINAGMMDGDYILVQQQRDARNGDIIVALIENDEATVKRFFKESEYIRLQAENDDYEPIITENITVLGKVVGLFRKF